MRSGSQIQFIEKFKNLFEVDVVNSGRPLPTSPTAPTVNQFLPGPSYVAYPLLHRQPVIINNNNNVNSQPETEIRRTRTRRRDEDEKEKESSNTWWRMGAGVSLITVMYFIGGDVVDLLELWECRRLRKKAEKELQDDDDKLQNIVTLSKPVIKTRTSYVTDMFLCKAAVGVALGIAFFYPANVNLYGTIGLFAGCIASFRYGMWRHGYSAYQQRVNTVLNEIY